MSDEGGFSWTAILLVVLPVVLAGVSGAVGYVLKGWLERRSAPRIGADTEVFKQFGVERLDLLNELDRPLSHVDHWIRDRIPREDEAGKKEFIAASRKEIEKARRTAREGKGLLLEERNQLWELVRSETDAASACLSAYERGEPTSIDAFVRARKERLGYMSRLEGTLRIRQLAR